MKDVTQIKLENLNSPLALFNWFVLYYIRDGYMLPAHTTDLLLAFIESLRFDSFTLDDKSIVAREGIQTARIDYPEWYRIMSDSLGFDIYDKYIVLLKLGQEIHDDAYAGSRKQPEYEE